MVLDYDETILIIFFLHEHMATSFLGKVKKYGVITSYTETVIYFFIEWGPFRPQGMLNMVNQTISIPEIYSENI